MFVDLGSQTELKILSPARFFILDHLGPFLGINVFTLFLQNLITRPYCYHIIIQSPY